MSWLDAYSWRLPAGQENQPAHPPSVNEVLRLIATLGGFLARKGDRKPGVKSIWQGMRRVMDATATLRTLRRDGEALCRKAMG